MGKFELNSPDVLEEDFGEDLVLLNLQSGSYYNLTERAKAFLIAVLNGVDPEKMCEELKAVDPQAGTDAGDFFERLLKHKLVRECSGTTADVPSNPQVDAVLSAGSSFGFEHFDDLSDLLLADPIHDVDSEAGWPVRS